MSHQEIQLVFDAVLYTLFSMFMIAMFVATVRGYNAQKKEEQRISGLLKKKSVYVRHIFNESALSFSIELKNELDSVKEIYDIIEIKYEVSSRGFSALIIMQ